MQKLLKDFNGMRNIPMFEIEVDGEYHVFNIQANEEVVEACRLLLC